MLITPLSAQDAAPTPSPAAATPATTAVPAVPTEASPASTPTLDATAGTIEGSATVTATRTLAVSAPDASQVAPGRALLRVMHLSSGTPALDIYIDGEIRRADFGGDDDTAALRFPSATGWMPFEAGEIEVVVRVSDAEDTAPDEPLLPAAVVALDSGAIITLAIIGTLANETLQVWPIREDFGDVSPDTARLGLFNAHAGVAAVEVRLDDASDSLTPPLGYPGFFGDNDGFVEVVVNTGTYDLSIQHAEDGEALVTLPVDLRAGRNYFLAVIPADPPYFLTFSDLNETQRLLEP